jgi:hypothetical protein
VKTNDPRLKESRRKALERIQKIDDMYPDGRRALHGLPTRALRSPRPRHHGHRQEQPGERRHDGAAGDPGSLDIGRGRLEQAEARPRGVCRRRSRYEARLHGLLHVVLHL